MSRLLPLSLLLLTAVGGVHAAPTPITIEQAMADPDWIGPPVESAWWSWNGQQVEYTLKRKGSPVRDTFRQPVAGGAAAQVADDQRGTLDAATRVYDRQRQRMAFVRNGDVFVRDLRSGALTQLTRGNERATGVDFATDGGLVWNVGNNWYHWNANSGVIALVAQLKAEKNPAEAPKADVLRDQQMRTLETLRRDRAQREALREQGERWRQADPTRAPGPVYLGADVEIVDSALSPDATHLIVATKPKNFEDGRGGKMPLYVTESGYEETEDTRTRVGRNGSAPHALWFVDAASGQVRPLALDALPGIGVDPLAALRKAAGKEPLKGDRTVQVMSDFMGGGIRWSADGKQAAVMLRANDNKDRWIVSVGDDGRMQNRHRLTDPGWINWGFNDFGWMADGRTLWLLSEESGFSHLYTQAGTGKPRALTSGKWETSAPVPSADGKGFYVLCNQQAPHDYEVCGVDAASGQVRELTDLNGVEDFSLSPDGSQLLVRYSGAYVPPQLAVVPAAGGSARVLTDTRSAEFKAREWIQPQLVAVPSKHGAGVVWAKFYGPAQKEPGRKYPVVMFVHGAGYLQNVHQRYPTYFREQMFHNLLVQKGYIVLDMDYRGSEGYGRDWRTAIYRNMGHPELEDYQDGLEWLVHEQQGDRDHAGIYGGSYGGFMTYMALYRAPGTFKAGAALRPVGDWHQYNHGYTSNILNTPDIDPEAYRVSSPIGYADGLQDHLLIAHGMMDDNVFFQDSVNMTQRLIELHKDNWSIAPYPLERHGFTRADSWLDEYKRILNLFEEQLK